MDQKRTSSFLKIHQIAHYQLLLQSKDKTTVIQPTQSNNAFQKYFSRRFVKINEWRTRYQILRKFENFKSEAKQKHLITMSFSTAIWYYKKKIVPSIGWVLSPEFVNSEGMKLFTFLCGLISCFSIKFPSRKTFQRSSWQIECSFYNFAKIVLTKTLFHFEKCRFISNQIHLSQKFYLKIEGAISLFLGNHYRELSTELLVRMFFLRIQFVTGRRSQNCSQ